MRPQWEPGPWPHSPRSIGRPNRGFSTAIVSQRVTEPLGPGSIKATKQVPSQEMSLFVLYFPLTACKQTGFGSLRLFRLWDSVCLKSTKIMICWFSFILSIYSSFEFPAGDRPSVVLPKAGSRSQGNLPFPLFSNPWSVLAEDFHNKAICGLND